MAASDMKEKAEPHGALARAIARHYPSVLDPAAGTLVWGAPSVDRIGRIGDRGRPA